MSPAVAGPRSSTSKLIQRAGGRAAALFTEPGLGVIHQDTSHLPRGHGEEMRAVLPGDIHLDQLDERFVNDGRGLQRVARPLALHVAAGAVAQLLIYERRQSFQGAGVP